MTQILHCSMMVKVIIDSAPRGKCDFESRESKIFSRSSHVKHVQIDSNPQICANSPQRQKPPWHTQAPRSFSRHVAHQLLHDTRLPTSASHLYLPCALCTSLQAILLAFPQWWIRISGIISDDGAGSGATCNQPARDSWWLSHATLSQLHPI